MEIPKLREFSINKEIIVPNLTLSRSLLIGNMQISNNFIRSVRNSHWLYEEALKDQKTNLNIEEDEKRQKIANLK